MDWASLFCLLFPVEVSKTAFDEVLFLNQLSVGFYFGTFSILMQVEWKSVPRRRSGRSLRLINNLPRGLSQRQVLAQQPSP